MRRIVPRSPVSENPREFVLAALLFTIGAVLLAGFAMTQLAGNAWSGSDLKSADLAYQVVGWGKYIAGVRLLYLGDRATLRHGYLGAKRLALLWLPLLLFVVYGYLQWTVIGGARTHYLQRTGHWEGGFSEPALFMAFAYPVAFALTAVNAIWIQRQQRHIVR
ncbi:MAG: hypothetical protein JO306_08695 [Gemmatimonadetes bacterium]|nr:hypothetical protein [Gemmatimonadota bacterium]